MEMEIDLMADKPDDVSGATIEPAHVSIYMYFDFITYNLITLFGKQN